MSFLYSFLNLFQPGILWPSLAPFKPMMIASVFAVISGLLRSPQYEKVLVFKHPAFKLLLLFIIIQVISFYYGGIAIMLDKFLIYYQYAVFMIIAVLLISDIDDLNKFIWGMIVSGSFIVVYGIYIANAGLGITVGGNAAGAYGMYENHNDYSYIIIIIFPFIYMFQRSATGIKKAFLRVGVVACCIGILLSLSRGGILAFVLEITLLVLMIVDRRKRIPLLVIVAVVGMSVIGFLYAKRDEYGSSSYTAKHAESSRIELWKAGLDMFLKNPIIGVGSRSFGEYANEYYELSHDQKGKNAHNTYIEILATTGLLGFISFIGFAWYLIKSLHIKLTIDINNKLEVIRIGTLVSFYSLLFRGITNSKPFEWGFYMLCVIGVVCVVLIQKEGNKNNNSVNENGAISQL